MNRLLCLSLTCIAVLTLGAPAPATDTATLDSSLAALPTVEYGSDPALLAGIPPAIAQSAADRALRQRLERAFIDVLKGTSTTAAKDYACRSLGVVGSDAAVPALAVLLANPDLSSVARVALERIPGPAPEAALREALPKLSGRLQIAVISSLGTRRDPKAVKAITAGLASTDLAVAQAAATSLGQIATPEAATALLAQRTKGAEALRTSVDAACVDAADRLLAARDTATAVRLFRAVESSGASGELRMAAWQGLVIALPKEAPQRLLEALQGPDAERRGEAVRLIGQARGQRTPSLLLEQLPRLSAEARLGLLEALRRRADPGSRTAVLTQVDHPDAATRVAALQVLAVVGDARDIPQLADRAAQSPPAEREAARQALVQLPALNAGRSFAAQVTKVAPGARVELLRAMAARREPEGPPAAAGLLADPDPAVVRTALQVLADAGTVAEIPAVLKALNSAPAAQRETLADALESISRRMGASALPPLRPAWTAADRPTRVLLVRAVGATGGAAALELVRQAVQQSDPQLRDAAVRALAEWPDLSAAADLEALLRQPADNAQRVLAYRGLVRMARESESDAEARLRVLQSAMQLGQTAEDRKLVLGALGEVTSVKALTMVEPHLDDPALVEEAGAAAVRIASRLDASQRAAVTPVLQHVIKVVPNESIRNDARRQIRGL